MELLNFLRSRLLHFAGQRVLLVSVALLALGGAAVGGALFLPSALMIAVGSLGGLMWFLAADALWSAVLPAAARRRLDLRGNRPLVQRRAIAGAILIAWFLTVIFIDRGLQDSAQGTPGAALESPLLGALTVVVALCAFRIGSASADERLDEAQAYEAWLARQQKTRNRPPRRWGLSRWRGEPPVADD